MKQKITVEPKPASEKMRLNECEPGQVYILCESYGEPKAGDPVILSGSHSGMRTAIFPKSGKSIASPHCGDTYKCRPLRPGERVIFEGQ